MYTEYTVLMHWHTCTSNIYILNPNTPFLISNFDHLLCASTYTLIQDYPFPCDTIIEQNRIEYVCFLPTAHNS